MNPFGRLPEIYPKIPQGNLSPEELKNKEMLAKVLLTQLYGLVSLSNIFNQNQKDRFVKELAESLEQLKEFNFNIDKRFVSSGSAPHNNLLELAINSKKPFKVKTLLDLGAKIDDQSQRVAARHTNPTILNMVLPKPIDEDLIEKLLRSSNSENSCWLDRQRKDFNLDDHIKNIAKNARPLALVSFSGERWFLPSNNTTVAKCLRPLIRGYKANEPDSLANKAVAKLYEELCREISKAPTEELIYLAKSIGVEIPAHDLPSLEGIHYDKKTINNKKEICQLIANQLLFDQNSKIPIPPAKKQVAEILKKRLS